VSDYSDKTVLLATHGLYAGIAERLARDFGRVLLHVPYNSHSFPGMDIGRVGEGLDGVEKVESIWGKHLNEIDLFVFPDLYFADEQCRLEEMGKNVWGGRQGEEIEVFREICKQQMEKLGLPVQKWKIVRGVSALREHLQAHQNQHVKIDKWRGQFETFFSENYDVSKVKIDEVELDAGIFAEDTDFIVEDDLPDCVESGIDTYCIDGMHPPATIVGIEVKDLGYVGQFQQWDKIPEPVRRWNEAMAEVFATYGYRGWLSNEIRIGRDLVPYMIDATCRKPCPPGELLQEFYVNYADILWHGAQGQLVAPVPRAQWGVEVLATSDFAEDRHQPVTYPKQFANQVKVFNPAVVDGLRAALPLDHMCQCAAIVGWGNTLEAAIAHMGKAADAVKGHGIKIPRGSIDQATEAMEQLAEFGLPVFDLKEGKPT
jgi:hypothetical protein